MRSHSVKNLNSGEVFHSFENRDSGRLVDASLDRERDEWAVDLQIEPGFEFFHRHLYPAGESREDFGALRLTTEQLPVDRHGQHPLVASQNSTFDVEDPASFWRNSHEAGR